MPFDDTKILECNQCQISDKAPFIIFADLESIIEKNDGCKNCAENLSKTKISEHIPSGFSMFWFRSMENNHDVYRRKDCIKKFWGSSQWK